MSHTEYASLAPTHEMKSSAPPAPRNFVSLRVGMLGEDRRTMFLLRRTLLAAGHSAQRYRSATELTNALKNTHLDILVLGVMGPRAGEVDLLARLRADLNMILPVIVVRNRDDEDYIVQALRSGADDCVIMPIGQREFLARVEAITRRWVHIPKPAQTFRVGDITVHVQSRRILVDGHPAELTIKDFDVALFLLRNVGRLVTRSQLLHAVWGSKPHLLRSRTLDTHISRVRRRLKLLESRGWRLNAVYRKGYRLERLKDEGPQETRR